jgi:NTP pyrophosphatase (non-canonical NTP hydrolase)
MSFEKLTTRAMNIRALYKSKESAAYGRAWTREEIMLGMVGDVGDLAKLVLAQEGVRDIPDHNSKLKHELSDCLWSLLVLSNEYGIDLEHEFLKTMDNLERKLEE